MDDKFISNIDSELQNFESEQKLHPQHIHAHLWWRLTSMNIKVAMSHKKTITFSQDHEITQFLLQRLQNTH